MVQKCILSTKPEHCKVVKCLLYFFIAQYCLNLLRWFPHKTAVYTVSSAWPHHFSKSHQVLPCRGYCPQRLYGLTRVPLSIRNTFGTTNLTFNNGGTVVQNYFTCLKKVYCLTRLCHCKSIRSAGILLIAILCPSLIATFHAISSKACAHELHTKMNTAMLQA